MKYIQTNFQNIISVLDEKVQVNNINNFVIFQTEDTIVLEKLNTNKYLVNSTKLSNKINLALEDYLKNNPLEEVTEPIYECYRDKLDDEGNVIGKEGYGNTILGIEDIKSNMKVEAKRNMLKDFSITITNDNFDEYFIEQEKTEIEKLNKQIKDLTAENKLLNQSIEDLSLAMADLMAK
ncbi:MAG: hypothetical protein SPI06_05300 [Terrisporobacter sp.]|uniref:hypothetical protein n=1 Tax=Terrisporobacter sp. TaxID=1965305 RepID=UPI002A91787C|nr:hypothetical protein [Terrisporobacter sp.]MDY6152810.1 hypothetical protein [Terrisporobacter sp.]